MWAVPSRPSTTWAVSRERPMDLTTVAPDLLHPTLSLTCVQTLGSPASSSQVGSWGENMYISPCFSAIYTLLVLHVQINTFTGENNTAILPIITVFPEAAY